MIFIFFFFCLPPGSKFGTGLSVKHELIWCGPTVTASMHVDSIGINKQYYLPPSSACGSVYVHHGSHSTPDVCGMRLFIELSLYRIY